MVGRCFQVKCLLYSFTCWDKPHPPTHLYLLYTWSQSWMQLSVWHLLGTRLNKNTETRRFETRDSYMLSYQLLLIPNADPISCQQLGQSENDRGWSRNGGRNEIDITIPTICTHQNKLLMCMGFTWAGGPPCEVCNNTYVYIDYGLIPKHSVLLLVCWHSQTIHSYLLSSEVCFLSSRRPGQKSEHNIGS